MQYRPFGSVDFQVSALGFGCMRLPTCGEAAKVDQPQAIQMIRRAIDQGVNYVDTAHGYHGGQSEVVVGKALQDGYREKVALATKLPLWDVKEAADFDRLLNEQLERLQTEYLDFYLLHNIQAPYWKRMCELGVRDWLDKTLADGRIRHAGFSFHDTFDVLKEVLAEYDHWSMCQVQYNYVNENVQAGTAGVEYAGDQGVAVVIMEPLFGGALANPPEPVRAVLNEAPGGARAVDLALRWLWHKPQIACVLSGMSTPEQVEENLEIASRSGVGEMSAEDLALVGRLRDAYKDLHPIPCTRCGYCMPCPQGVDIPENFQLYNNATVHQGSPKNLNRNLYVQMAESERAAACIACHECEAKCPQSIPISEWMPKVDELFGPKKDG